MQRQSLSVDLDSLFPGTAVQIGEQSIVIRPLGIEQLAIISKKITGIMPILEKKRITWENFNSPANLFQLALIALSNVPDVLEEAANINIEDLKKLPIELVVKIIDAIIVENLKSKEDLEKNFKSLTDRFLQTEKTTDPKNLTT